MSRTLKLILFAAVAEMTLVALAVIAWRHGAFPELPTPLPHTRTSPLVFFLPPWIAFSAFLIGRRLKSDRPRVAERTRRFFDASLRAVAAMSVALQGLFAYIAVTDATMSMGLIRRVILAVIGLWLVSYGNAAAKLDPPSGEGALPPGIWARLQLRLGWMTVVWGVVILASALALPQPLLAPVMIVTTAIVLAVLVVAVLLRRPAPTS